jgi:SH3-like domain-containing protein
MSLAASSSGTANAPEERTIGEVIRAKYQEGTSQRAARYQESIMKVTMPGSKQLPLLDVPSPVTLLPSTVNRMPGASSDLHVTWRFHTCVAGRLVQVIDAENSWYWTVQSAGMLAA